MTYYTCIASAPRTKFLVELHATAFDFGLISALSSLMLVFQLVSGVWTNRTRHRKRVWMTVYLIHRLLFLGVLAAPSLFTGDRVRLAWIISVLTANSALSHLGNPMWFSWMTDLIPRESLNVHWAVRQRFISACNFVAQLGVAFLFSRFERQGQVIQGFLVLGGIGMALGVLDICLFTGIPEPPNACASGRRLREALTEPVHNPDFRPYLLFRAYWNFALMVSAPFFSVYLIKEMKLSTFTVQLTFIGSSLGVVAASRLWGTLCDTYGHRPALQIVSLVKPLVPFVYLVVPPVPWIAVPVFALLSLADGMVNAGGRIATQGVMLKDTPRRNRAMYIAATNFLALGVAGGLAPLLSGSLIAPLTHAFAFSAGVYRFTGYHLVFLLGFLLRAGAFPLARRLREPESASVRTVVSYLNRADSLPAFHAVSQLEDATNEPTRFRAVYRLRRLASPVALAALVAALHDSSPRVRALAADALGRVGLAAGAASLAEALEDPDPHVRWRVARALGNVPCLHSVSALRAHLAAADPVLLVRILASLGRLGDATALPALRRLLPQLANDDLRRVAARAAAQLERR